MNGTTRRYGVIFEDDWIMVVDKPSGMLTIPTPRGEKHTLTGLINDAPERRAVEQKVHPCHRLDRDTSGVIIYAKGKTAQGLVMDQFRARSVKKVYVALVDGSPRKDASVMRSPIFSKNRHQAEDAETRYRVVERRRGYAVVEVEPLTGRTNQIRIHFKREGHPLLGERVYAFRKDFTVDFKRVALHAWKIEFTHPITKERLVFTSKLPDDMRRMTGVGSYR